jgi:hypothetical protein
MAKIGLVPCQRGNNLRTAGEPVGFGGPGMVPGLLAAPAMDAMSTPGSSSRPSARSGW